MLYRPIHVSLPVRYLVITDLFRDKVFPKISKKKKKIRPTDPTDCSTVSRTTNFFFFGLILVKNNKTQNPDVAIAF